MNNLKNSITIAKAWRKVRDNFSQANIANSNLDARILAQHAFELTALELAIKENDLVSSEQLRQLEKLVSRRLEGEPIARIMGTKEFYGLEFKLNAATLVPRPETELLVDLALKQMHNIKHPNFLELGVGSGCIFITLLNENKKAKAIGVDISQLAIKQSNENAFFYEVDKRVDLQVSSWFENIDAKAKFDIIISNPPYIKAADILHLDIEVKKFDPELALNGGKDGLDPYRIIAKNAKQYLTENGAIIVEFGLGQEEEILQIFKYEGFRSINLYHDLSGIIRAMIINNN